MIKYLPLFLSSVIILGLSSCIKDDEITGPEPRGTIEEYIVDNDTSGYTTLESGLIYKVESKGEGEDLSSEDIVEYQMMIYALDGELIYNGFASNQRNWVTALDEDRVSILAVQEILNLSSIGDSIVMLVPSELGWGPNGSGAVIYKNEDLRVSLMPIEIRLTIPEYLAVNGIEGFQVTTSGLHYVLGEDVDGEKPVAGNKVEVHYTGYHFNGEKFDSSVDIAESFSFILGQEQVIAGWDEGIALLKKGQKATFYIPYESAYGILGYSNIGPYENLIFEVELINFIK
ncbi:MAG: FKBP-type peptidyl-prolyl cis-trans isomerase [Reichenbachiella sp.]